MPWAGLGCPFGAVGAGLPEGVGLGFWGVRRGKAAVGGWRVLMRVPADVSLVSGRHACLLVVPAPTGRPKAAWGIAPGTWAGVGNQP